MNWYIGAFKKYVDFTGRAQRAEYWFFFLFNLIVAVVLAIIDAAMSHSAQGPGVGILGLIYALAAFLPGLAVTVRRLHDTDRSGWWILIGLIPLIGAIILLVFMIIDSTPGANEYGANPKTA